MAEVKIQVLEERLRLERIARYGKRSETLSDLQLELLDRRRQGCLAAFLEKNEGIDVNRQKG